MAEHKNDEEDGRNVTTEMEIPAADVTENAPRSQTESSAIIQCTDEAVTPTTTAAPLPVTKLNLEQIVPDVTECPPAETDSTNNHEVQAAEAVDFKVIYKKQKYDVTFPLDETVAALKVHIETLIGVPAVMQKVMFKGLAKEDKSLRELGVVAGTKLMVVGSTMNDVLAVNTPTGTRDGDDKDDKDSAAVATKEPLCKQPMHKKVLDKGVPDDVMLGIKNEKDNLPPFPLTGMLNKGSGKVRLTFKLEVDQLWIGTKDRTDKIPMNSIKNVTSEPIEGHAEYHILGIQLGPTEASRYWIYWVPSQYIEAIKDAILGKWQTF